jgi:hypothetical protein
MTRNPPSASHQFAECICNEDYPVALELHRIYEVLPDAQAERYGMVRVLDESGEGYLYPRDFFRPVTVSRALEAELRHAS